MAPAVEQLVVHWGDLGERWGVNRSVAQIHALLYLADGPLTAETIADQLRLARSNVSTSLRELTAWSLVRRVPVLGDRRDYYEAEADMLEMVRRIVAGRKAREIDPALEALSACVAAAETDDAVSPRARRRLIEMRAFTEDASRACDELMALPSPVLSSLLRAGGAVARFVGRKPRGAARVRQQKSE